MRTAFSIVFSLAPGAALAHPSFAPHEHPHDWSMLPGADLIVLAAIIFGFSAVALAYVKRR